MLQKRFRAIVAYKLRRMEVQTRKTQKKSLQLLAGWTMTVAAAPATLASIATLSHRFVIHAEDVSKKESLYLIRITASSNNFAINTVQFLPSVVAIACSP